MTDKTHQVAVLGLGRMGSAVATRLATQGHRVQAWSRTPQAESRVAGPDDGGVSSGHATVQVRRTSIEAVAGADIVILTLFDGDACRAVLDSCLDSMAPDVVVVNASTVGPDEAESLERMAEGRSRAYLHAPVMGSVPAVHSGSLTVLAGCRAMPAHVGGLLDALGTVLPCGSARAAAAAKLVANQVLAESLVALGRVLASGVALGLDRALVVDVLERTVLGRVVEAKRPWLDEQRMAQPVPYLPAAFTVKALSKDMRLLDAEVPAIGRLRHALAVADACADGKDVDVAEIMLRLGAGPRVVDTPSRLFADAGAHLDPDLLRPLVEYARGHATGDPDHFRRAFRPTAHVEGLRDGVFTSWDLDSYCQLFAGEPAPDESSRRRVLNEAECSSTVAHATMRLHHGPDTFTDKFVLVQDRSEWRIANKVYVRET